MDETGIGQSPALLGKPLMWRAGVCGIYQSLSRLLRLLEFVPMMGYRRPVWVPQYGFDFGNIFHVLNHGLDMDDVKIYLRAFNQGVKEKLIKPTLPGISGETLEYLRRSACGMSRYIQSNLHADLHVMGESDLQADFSLD